MIRRVSSSFSTADRSCVTAATTKRRRAITKAAAGTSPQTRSLNTYTRPTTIDPQTLDSHRRRCAEPVLQPDAATLTDLSRQALDWVLRHYATLPQQSVGRTASRAHMEALLREPPPEQGQDFADVLAEFEQKVSANAFRTSHPRFLAFIPGAPTFLSVLGDLLCAGTNFFCGVCLEASGPSMVEVLAIDRSTEVI